MRGRIVGRKSNCFLELADPVVGSAGHAKDDAELLMRVGQLRRCVNRATEERLRSRWRLEFQRKPSEREVVLRSIRLRRADVLKRGKRSIPIASRRQRAGEIVTGEIDVETAVDPLAQVGQRRRCLTGLEQRLPVAIGDLDLRRIEAVRFVKVREGEARLMGDEEPLPNAEVQNGEVGIPVFGASRPLLRLIVRPSIVRRSAIRARSSLRPSSSLKGQFTRTARSPSDVPIADID